MSQTIAVVLPLPVALALLVLLLVLVALSAVVLSLRQPPPLRLPEGQESDKERESAFRLGRLQIDALADLSAPQRQPR
jgi:hypothetical protein